MPFDRPLFENSGHTWLTLSYAADRDTDRSSATDNNSPPDRAGIQEHSPTTGTEGFIYMDKVTLLVGGGFAALAISGREEMDNGIRLVE